MAKKDLVKEAVVEIEGWIRNGKFANLELLPSELEISKQLDVSRATVRDAIRILEVRGYVERLHGIGVKVNNKSIEVAISFMSDMLDRNEISYNEVFEIRTLLEPKACFLAAKNASKDDINKLEAYLNTMDKRSPSSESYQECDHNFHARIAKASGNRLLYTIMESYSPLLFRQISEADKKDRQGEPELHYHRDIFNCIVDSDPEGAMEGMLTHLIRTEKNLK